MGLVQFLGQCGQQRLGLERGAGVVRLAHPSPDRSAHLLGQVVTHVPQLVDLAPTDDRLVEHLLHRSGQHLGTV